MSMLLENIPNDLSTPEKLKEIIRLLRYEDLGVCFDVGHAHLMSSAHQAFSVLEDRIRSTHIHDNKRDKDSHLWPGDGTIEWEQTMSRCGTRRALRPCCWRSKARRGWMFRARWRPLSESWKRREWRRSRFSHPFRKERGKDGAPAE